MIDWNKPLRVHNNSFWKVLSAVKSATLHPYEYYIVTIGPSETNKAKPSLFNQIYVVDCEGRLLGDKTPFIENIPEKKKYKVTLTRVFDSESDARSYSRYPNWNYELTQIDA